MTKFALKRRINSHYKLESNIGTLYIKLHTYKFLKLNIYNLQFTR